MLGSRSLAPSTEDGLHAYLMPAKGRTRTQRRGAWAGLIHETALGRKGSSQAERPVAGARIVGKVELWAKACAAGAGGDGHVHRDSAGDRGVGKLSADAMKCAAALGEENGRCRGWTLLEKGFSSIALGSALRSFVPEHSHHLQERLLP